MITKTYSFEKDGKVNSVYTLLNKSGAKAEVLTYGARLISLSVPNKTGSFTDVIVGCKSPEDYYQTNGYYGSTVGRYCNRIGNAEFELNGVKYVLEKNDGLNTLHGGNTANFDRVVWNAEIKGNSLSLYHFSADGDGGYPGNMSVEVKYTLTDDNELTIEYFAESDKDTVCNLTNHAFFNLSDLPTVLEHELMINANGITPCREDLIPHGEIQNITGTPYSFLPAKKIGKDIFDKDKMISFCNGYDFNYCLNRKTKNDLEFCANLYSPQSGISMDCYTTKPGLQIYTSNEEVKFNGKKSYGVHSAICLETQFYPNSPNCKEYPSATLKVGEKYSHKTVYKFSVR